MIQLMLLFCFALALAQASDSPVQVTDKRTYLELKNQTQSDIAAIKLGDAHWLFRYDEPVLKAGSMVMERSDNGNTVTGVAFENGNIWGDPEIRALKRMRDQMRAGSAVNLRGARPIWFRTLLLYHRDRHPGAQVQTYDSDDDPHPLTMSTVWANFISFSVFGTRDSVPVPFGLDHCIAPSLNFGGPPASGHYLTGQFSASCPLPGPYSRTHIGGASQVMDFCPPGTPGSFATLGIGVAATYGQWGFGGTCQEMWGGGAVASFNINGTTYYAIMEDSCNYSGPNTTGFGQGGGCQN